MAADEILRPTENFALVSPGIYRSSFPAEKNFAFLKTLKLQAVLTLVPEDMPENLLKFYEDNQINFFQIGVPGNKEPFVDIPDDKIVIALECLLDVRNHPILVHCNQVRPCWDRSLIRQGKHRTGCLVGCLRKIQNWSHTSICEEYQRYAQPKARALDQQFIELFDVSAVRLRPKYKPEWLELP